MSMEFVLRAVTGIAFHLFATIALVALAAPGVTEWRTLGFVGLVGLAVDLLRHVMSPECRTSVKDIWSQFAGGITGTEAFKNDLRFWIRAGNCTALVWTAYAILFALLVRPADDYVGQPYLAMAEPIARMYSAVSSISRRASFQLVQDGHGGRAEIVSLFIAGNLPFFVLVGAMVFAGYGLVMALRQMEISSQRGWHVWGAPRTRAVALLLFILSIFSHFSLSNVFLSVVMLGRTGICSPAISSFFTTVSAKAVSRLCYFYRINLLSRRDASRSDCKVQEQW